MFGNNNQDNVNDQQMADNGDGLGSSMPPQDNTVPTLPTMPGSFGSSPFGQAHTQQSSDDSADSPQPGTPPLLEDEGTPDQAPQSPEHTDALGSAPAAPTGDLVGIKQQALQQLSPLVSHLDQTPEEKFRTTMMMIQATDDQSLLKTAYDSAQQITDDKARAQALLDVINEINYFTQQHNNS